MSSPDLGAKRNKPGFRRLPLSALTSALVVSSPGYACGPDLPNRLLTDRNGTLLYMPEGNFAFETSRLVAADKQLPMWKHAAPTTAPAVDTPSPDLWKITQMRATTIEAAWSLGEELSPAARLYTTGAVAFAQHDTRAIDYFTQLRALPKAEQEDWGLMAQYSLGRALMSDYAAPQTDEQTVETSDLPATSAGTAVDKAHLQQALAAFQQVIDAVKGGEADPHYLALSSLGQQARIHFWLDDIPRAAHLYAQQAAQGNTVGGLSLQYVSSYLVDPQHFEALKEAIADPLIQQLVTIELFARGSNLQMMDTDSNGTRSTRITHQVLDLLNSTVKAGFRGSDRLAALAYRSGQYPMAASLLRNAGDSGLAWWLRAKMALRDGDVNEATAAYAKAAAAFPASETWSGQRDEDDDDFVVEVIVPECRVAGEQAILALSRGDYLQAMDLLYRGKDLYWSDVADVAERVLTLDELKGFVDKNAPPAATPLKPETEGEYTGQQLTTATQLREILARRLIRAGRYQEAIHYFEIPNYREWAQQYADQRKIADDGKTQELARAKAYYQAATLLRAQGMEFTGYEMSPDYAIYGGSYSDLGDAFNTTNLKHKSWISVAEATRASAALPEKDNRFLHYRWRAADLAVQAANLLPPKSQAYAAVLCNAASWVIKRDAKTGQQLYQRYIKNGTRYDWTPKFGYACPAPDFNTAS